MGRRRGQLEMNRYISDNIKIRFGSYFLEDMIDFIVSNFDPEDIYEFDKLANWAEKNGYIEKENE